LATSHQRTEKTDVTVISDPEAGRMAWRDVHASHADASPFCDPVFLDGLERILPWKRLFIHAPGLGAASVFVRRRGPVKDLVLPPFCPYSAVHPEEGVESEATTRSLLLSTPNLPPTRLFSLEPGLDESILGPAPEQGHTVTRRFTYHLSTAPIEDAVAAWSSSQRRSFRKYVATYRYQRVDAQDLTRASDTVRQDLKQVAALTAGGYDRHGSRLPLSLAGLLQLSEELIRHERGTLHLLRSSKSGSIEAGVLTLGRAGMAWYWLAGSLPGPAMTVLMGHVQDDLHHAGVPVLDLMGANTAGIGEFKRRFGGALVSYLHVRTATRAGVMAERAAQWIHRFRK